MVDLKNIYESLGFEKVQTYIQSGNIVFQSALINTRELEKLIFNAIQKNYGFDVPNIVLTPTGIETALKNNPFKDIEKMYFTFLAEEPKQQNINHLLSYQFENEYYKLSDQVIYLHCPNGAGRAKLNNNFFEQKLKVTATSRNLKTTKKLLEMAKFTDVSNS